MLKHASIYIDAIVVGERMRHVDQEKVDTLAKSMAAIGLQQPISIWAEKDAIEGAPDTLHLVAGLHRLRAAEQLGWEQIDAVYVELDDIDRRRWEIAENLHRAELTALERSEHVAEWIRLTEQAAAKAAADSEQDVRDSGKGISSQSETKSKRGRGRPNSGINQAARELNIPGKTERAKQLNAHRAVAVASLTDEAKETAKEVGLDDTRSALLEAAKADTAEEQVATLKEIAEKKQAKKKAKKKATRRKKSEDDEISWTDKGEPNREQLQAIRALNDAELCAFLLKVEGVGLIPALKSLARAA